MNNAQNIFAKHGFNLDRMISGSKSGYVNKHPKNQVVFNANVFSAEGKIWYGDLDLTLDCDKLQDAANELDFDLYILREHDGRFDNEELVFEEVKKRAVKVFYAQGSHFRKNLLT
jgi:hypothetical protein